jgi:bifunctional non-homologous end joining protein LigD
LIGGRLPGEGVNRDEIAVLLVGAHDTDGRLKFCGTVGAGLSNAHRRILGRVLSPLGCADSPFADPVPPFVAGHARWVRAEAIGDVEYRQMRGLLRHSSWKGLRDDLGDISLVVLPNSETMRSA